MLVEWADRVPDCLPRDRLEIRIAVTGPTARRFEIMAGGSLDPSVLEGLREARLRVRGHTSPKRRSEGERRAACAATTLGASLPNDNPP